MLEKLAQESYRYYKEVKFYLLLTVVVFGLGMLYASSGHWRDGNGMGSLLLFLGVYGSAILIGFCLGIFYMCFLYAFHPELNGKTAGKALRFRLTRIFSALLALGNSVLLYMVIVPTP